MKKKLIKKKIYTVEMLEYSDNSATLKRTNDGFNSFELLGLVVDIKEEILEQIRSNITPDIVERRVIVDKK